jgi:Domain of unknown function (DUF4440)
MRVISKQTVPRMCRSIVDSVLKLLSKLQYWASGTISCGERGYLEAGNSSWPDVRRRVHDRIEAWWIAVQHVTLTDGSVLAFGRRGNDAVVLKKAWISADRATIEQIIAPEWRSTTPDGRMTDRTTVLADVFEKGVHKIRRLEIDDIQARVFGDAAVVTGRTHGVGDFAGTPYDVVIRITDTFVRRMGRWQAVASHSSLEARR